MILKGCPAWTYYLQTRTMWHKFVNLTSRSTMTAKCFNLMTWNDSTHDRTDTDTSVQIDLIYIYESIVSCYVLKHLNYLVTSLMIFGARYDFWASFHTPSQKAIRISYWHLTRNSAPVSRLMTISLLWYGFNNFPIYIHTYVPNKRNLSRPVWVSIICLRYNNSTYFIYIFARFTEALFAMK